MKRSSSSHAVAAAALWLAAGTAAAHTGHGHDGLSPMQGLLHALGEPDHLLMLGIGGVICTLAAPRMLNRLRRGWQRLQRARRAGAARPSTPTDAATR
jgi:hydrogenase/urease accessory protein HupE